MFAAMAFFRGVERAWLIRAIVSGYLPYAGMVLTARWTLRKCYEKLVVFLAEVLSIPKSRIEIVAGMTGRDKLVSIIDMDVDTVHQRLLAHLD